MKTYIIGHQKPDTDSVVAAMALKYLFENKEAYLRPHAEAVIADPLNPETIFLFDKFGVDHPRQITAAAIEADDQVVLVDHNEEAQRLADLNPAQIVEIIDHHKVNINFSQPIFMTFKAWGSSCTVIYSMMKKSGIQPDKTLASLMLAAILSDTVGFKSATTTKKDQQIAGELAELAGMTDLDAFALEIFKAKSDISSLSEEEIVTNDYKVFDFGKQVLIDQLETVEQAEILANKKESLLAAMAKVKASQAVDLLFVAITDILAVNTKLLILGAEEAQVAERAFGGQTQDGVLDIGAKLSRKKEIAPAIEKALT